MNSEISTILKKMHNDHGTEMITGANSLLSSLIKTLERQNTKHNNKDSNFVISKASVINSMEEYESKISDDNLRKRVQQLNNFFEEQGFEGKLKSRKENYLIEVSETVISSMTQLQEKEAFIKRNLKTASQTTPENFQEPEAIPDIPIFQIFMSHKWHTDKDAQNTFNEFANELNSQLSALPAPWNDKFKLKLFYDASPTNGFTAHDPRLNQQDKACKEAALGLIFWSDLYVKSPDCQRELGFFVDKKGKNQLPKSTIVLLEHGRLKDMGLPYKNWVVQMPNDSSLVRFWSVSNSADKQDFISELREKVCKAIDSNFDGLITSYSKKTIPLKKKIFPLATSIPERVLKANEQLCDDGLEEPKAFHQNERSEERIPIVEELINWAYSNNKNTKRVTALLGDFGFGKTITCSLLAFRLGERFQNTKSGKKRVLPIYLDLKALLNDLDNNLTQPVEHLLETMINKTGDDHIEGKNIIEHIRNHPTLVIFDGFDEIGQKLNEAQQQNIYHKLLDIIPVEIYQQDLIRLENSSKQEEKEEQEEQEHFINNGFQSRILISCRTHFFNRMEKETSFLNGNHRHVIGEQATKIENLKRYYMAPFTDESIENFIKNVLGEDEGGKALSVIQEVHDLSELSSHPIMLKLITQHLPSLLEMRDQNKIINAATLYLKLFDAIGERDVEKHVIRLGDKQQLLASLALDLWRKNKTSLHINKLDSWFTKYGNEHPVLKNQFSSSTEAIAIMLQDLCNASLLVRDKDNHYRFSHTSYFEFFQALGIFETIRKSQSNDTFDIITEGSTNKISNETLRFLIDWRKTSETEERDEFDKQLCNLLPQNCQPTSKQVGFDIWRIGQLDETSFPHVNNPNWSDLKFKESFIPQHLNLLDLSEANLSGTYFHLVHFTKMNLSNVNFKEAHLYQCYFDNCDMSNTLWDNSIVKYSRNYKSSFPQPLPKELLDKTSWINVTPIQNKTITLRPPSFSKNIFDIKWHPQGKSFLSVTANGSIELWDCISAECIKTFEDKEGLMRNISWHPDGKKFLSGSSNGKIKLWDSKAGKCLANYKSHTKRVTKIKWHPDGVSFLSSSHDNSIKYWDSVVGECIKTYSGHKSTVTSIDWHPDGKQFLSASNDTSIKIWDSLTGQCLSTYQGHVHGVNDVDWHPDGKQFLSVSQDSLIKLWDITGGDCLFTYNDTNAETIPNTEISSIEWNPNGKEFVRVLSNRSITIWNITSKTPIQTFERNDNTASWHPNGKYLLSGGMGNAITLLDYISGECICRYGVTSVNYCHIVWRPGKNQFIFHSLEGPTITLWDSTSGKNIQSYNDLNNIQLGIAFHPKGNSFLSSSLGESINHLDADTGKCIQKFNDNEINTACGMSWDSKGERFLSISMEGIIKLWDAITGKLIKKYDIERSSNFKLSNNISWQPNGEGFLTINNDDNDSRNHKIQLWDIASGECLATYETSKTKGIKWHPDGKEFLSFSTEHTIKRWSINSTKCLANYKGHKNKVTSVSWHPDGKEFISAAYDNTIKHWDSASCKCVATYKEHKGNINSLEWHPDGDIFTSVSNNGFIKIWDGYFCEHPKLEIFINKKISISKKLQSEKQNTIIEIAGDAWKHLAAESTDDNGEITIHPPTIIPEWEKLYKDQWLSV